MGDSRLHGPQWAEMTMLLMVAPRVHMDAMTEAEPAEGADEMHCGCWLTCGHCQSSGHRFEANL